MKLMKRRILAAVLSLSMVATMLPTQGMQVKAAQDDDTKVLAQFSFDDEATGFVGGNAKTTNHGVTISDDAVFGKSAYFNGKSYLSVAAEDGNSLLTGKDQITISYLRKIEDGGVGWSVYASRNADAPTYGIEKYVGIIDKNDSVRVERYNNTGKREDALVVSGNYPDWQLVTAVLDTTKTTVYVNGKYQGETKGYEEKTLSGILGDNSILYVGRANWGSGEYFKGYIDNFTIYDGILSEDQIKSLYNDVETALTEKQLRATIAKVDSTLESTILNGNAADNVAKNLNFPAQIEGIDFEYSVSDESLVSTKGEILYSGAEKVELKVTATGSVNGKVVIEREFTFQVTNPLRADYDALELVDVDNVKGNLTLPTEGKNGSTITWTSDNTDVITDKAVENTGYAATPAGVVTRQAADTKVKLTATLTNLGETLTKEFEVTVKAKKEQEKTTDYLFAYFTGNSIAGENIYFATSQDGYFWEEINDQDYVLTSEYGEKGLRDPYIMRSKEGDKFYLIATDLSIGRNGDWGKAQNAGSQAIMVWESDDLVHWSEQRMVTISDSIEAGCTWAPEAYYDDITGEYVVFWASRIKKDGYSLHRIFYSKTRDFRTFTKPEVWIDRETAQTIDTTVVAGTDGYLYRISKNEGDAVLPDGTKITGATVYMEKAKSLFGEWTRVEAPSLETIKGVEGPTAYKLNEDDAEEDTWCVLLDHYGNGGYRPYITKDIVAGSDSAEFAIPAEYALPSAPRHGTVLPVTANEYKALMKAFGEAGTDDTDEEDRDLSENVLAAYSMSEKETGSATAGTVVKDESGNGFDARIEGKNGSFKDGTLYLPGGAANSGAAYVSVPGGLFAKQDTLTITVWLKNDTGAGNYAAMSFGTKTKHLGDGTADKPANYWLLNPAAPGGYFKSVWTNGTDAGSPWTQETATSGYVTGSDWAMYTTVITPTTIRGYYNGKQVSKSSKTVTTTDFGNELVAAIGRSGYSDPYYKGGVSNVVVYNTALSQSEIAKEYEKVSLEKAKVSLTLADTTDITSDITLPTKGLYGTTVSWKSSDADIVSETGKVNRPHEDKSYEVTLTATISLGETSVTKEFKVTVLGASDKTLFAEAMAAFELGVVRTDKDIELPKALDLAGTSIEWSTSNAAVLTNTGKVTRPSADEADAQVKLSALVTFAGAEATLTDSKEFTVIVRAQDYAKLLAYTSSKENASLGNSLHLAYSVDGDSFVALNSNTGICFANNAGGAKNVNPNSLGSFVLFRKADGTYGLLAKNATTAGSYVYAFDSTDLINFTSEKKLKVSASVSEVLGCAVEADGTYTVYWKNGSTVYATKTADFEKAISSEKFTGDVPVAKGTVKEGAVLPEGAVANDVFKVSKSEYTAVVNKLGTVTNTGIVPVAVEAKNGAEVKLPSKVKAEYSDGSTTDMNVTWNLDGIDLTKAGTYEVQGTIKQTQYANPLIEQRADPCILLGDDGYYYFTASYPMVGGSDKDGYDKVVLRRSKTIEGLAKADEITIWDCDNSASEHRYVWAPEIHCIEGTYYVFYTSSVERNNVWGIRPHVLKCNNPEDIMNPASWEAKGVMQAIDGDSMAFSGFSLDMTIFENNGRYYVMWAQTDGFSSIFIAEVDKNAPWKCISKSAKISVPEYSWERVNENVDEGPNVIKRNGKLFCTFSAAGTGVEYCIGLLTADENADLLDKNSWVKQAYPILTSSDVKGEYGPGHNSFTVDEDGNDIFVYHARGQECYDKKCKWARDNSLYDPCRDARVKRVHWAADGTPILKMSYEQELLSTEITATVTINEDTVAPVAPVDPVDPEDPVIDEPDKPQDPDEPVDPVNPEVELVDNTITGVASVYNKALSSKAFVLKASANGAELSFASSNSKVVKVSKTGKVTIVGTGVSTITITSKETAKYKAATKKIQVRVAPGKAAFKKLKATKTKLGLTWKKLKGVSGYQIQISTSKKFAAKKTVTVNVKSNKVSTTLKKLKKNTTYYVRIRGFKTVKISGKSVKLNGSWSSVKKIKTKKK